MTRRRPGERSPVRARCLVSSHAVPVGHGASSAVPGSCRSRVFRRCDWLGVLELFLDRERLLAHTEEGVDDRRIQMATALALQIVECFFGGPGVFVRAL